MWQRKVAICGQGMHNKHKGFKYSSTRVERIGWLQMKGTPHAGAWAVVRHVVARQGVRGLWAGTLPAVVRAFPLPLEPVAGCGQPSLHGLLCNQCGPVS